MKRTESQRYRLNTWRKRAWFGQVLLVFGILAFWFWVVSLILVLGAELNSFLALRQRALPADVAGLIQIEAQRAVAAQAVPAHGWSVTTSSPQARIPGRFRRLLAGARQHAHGATTAVKGRRLPRPAAGPKGPGAAGGRGA